MNGSDVPGGRAGADRPSPPPGPLDRPLPPPPTARDRQAAARAWSELDGPQPTAMMPIGELGPPPTPPPVARPQVRQQPAYGGARVPPRPPVAPSRLRQDPPAPPRRTPGGLLAGRIIAAVLAVAVLVATGFYWTTLNNANASLADSNGVADAGDKGVVFRGGVNILLVGSDARTDQDGNPLTAEELAAVSTEDAGGGVNTDTIMVVHIPEGGAKATAVSLPRDTWIPQEVTDKVTGPYDDGSVGTYKPNKINSFYGAAKFYTEAALAKKGESASPARTKKSDEAGRTMLIKIVQAFTGLKIDHYAEVNLIGFYTLSNAVGGVPVCLNEKVLDPFSGADFPKGPQEISGKAALSFVRQRHGLPGGDLDRVRRQQAFLAGASRKMLSADVLANPAKLTTLVSAAGKSLTLDKGFNLADFAGQMSNLSGGNLTFTTIPTHGAAQGSGGADALGTDPDEIRAFFAALAGGSTATSSAAASAVDRSKITVDVSDATAEHRSGTPVWDKLVAAGFARGQNTDEPGSASNPLATTIIKHRKADAAAAAQVRAALGGVGTLTADEQVAAGHVKVLVGTDLAQRGNGLRNAIGALTAPSGTADPADGISAGGVPCVN